MNRIHLEVSALLLVAALIVNGCIDFPGPDGPPTLWNTTEYKARLTMKLISEEQSKFECENRKYATLEELANWYNGPDGLLNQFKRTSSHKSIEDKEREYYYLSSADESSWSVTAIPLQPGVTGENSYFADERGKLRMAAFKDKGDAPANRDSSVCNWPSRP